MSTQLQTPTEPITREGNVFRKTNAHKGRRLAVTPNNSSMRHLSYGRIILDRSTPEAKFETGERETGLICLSGEAEIALGSEHFTLKQYDSAYIPRKSSVRIHTSASVDIAEFAAEVSNDYPIQVVRYEDLKKDKSLHLTLGSGVATRQLDIMLGGNIEAGRLIIGLVVSEPGNWTSWPPHEHGAMLEEIYVYTGMPAPAFGVQFVYTDTKEPELVTLVREGDAVLIPRGYHPNVAAPGHRIGFLWAMAAHREKEDRKYGVVNVQPEFGQSGSGLEAARR